MSLDVADSYCINLTEEEKRKIDKQVRKNRFMLKFAIFFPLFSSPMLSVPFSPVAGFTTQQIVGNARNRAESAVAKKIAPLAQAVDDCHEAYNESKETKPEAYNESKETKETVKSVEEDVDKKWEKLSAEEKYESIRNSKTDSKTYRIQTQ